MKKELVIENKAGNFAEILTDYDLDSFKYEYEINNERSLTFTAYKAKGNEDILKNHSIAIIGSRNCSSYGKQIAKQFAYNLSKNNINIISGLAKGIDSSAHLGAIEANKSTIAVVGCGLDRVYPEENIVIFNKIINKGAVISEYIIGTKPEKTNFPARNRIISGISDGILVVEAGKKSGTFITVDFALEHGKNVYSIPRKYK